MSAGPPPGRLVMDIVGNGWVDQAASTTYEWRKVRIRSAPAGESAPAGSSTQLGRRRRDRYRAHTVVVKYHGGPESSWIVYVGKECWRFPGYTALDDVMARVLGQLPF